MSDQLEAEAVAPVETVGTESNEVTTTKTEQEPQDASTSDSATERVDDKEEAERKREEFTIRTAQENRELKRKLREADEWKKEQELKNAPQAPEVPAIPDYLDYDSDAEYQAAIAERDNKVREAAIYQQQQEAAKRREQEVLYNQQVKAQQEIQAKAEGYTKRAIDLGVKPEELRVAGNIVQSYGVSDEIAGAILEDDMGPLVTKYLASNPQAIEQLNSASVFQLGQVYSDIKSKASGLAPKTSEAPPPPDVLTGGIASTKRGPAGATFE